MILYNQLKTLIHFQFLYGLRLHFGEVVKSNSTVLILYSDYRKRGEYNFLPVCNALYGVNEQAMITYSFKEGCESAQ